MKYSDWYFDNGQFNSRHDTTNKMYVNSDTKQDSLFVN